MYSNIRGNYQVPYNYPNNSEEERFLLAPFLFGGLAGTALGYGLANNNNNQVMYPVYPIYPAYPTYPTTYPIYPTYSNTNYYY